MPMGLGFETARQLVAAGHTVYTAARNEDDAQHAAKELGARPIVLDVSDDVSVQAAAAHISREHGSLDVLVNNAGIPGAGAGKPVSDLTGADITAVLDTNVVGIVRVLHAFLPLLQRSGNGVIVNVGSGMGSFGRVQDPARVESHPYNPAYSASKAAVSMLTVQYAMAYPNLRINVVDPGPTSTGLNAFQATRTVEQGAVAIVRAAQLTAAGPTGSFFDDAGASPW
ncbi:SDR family NAD(P)-dependent oxidoreductase [Streptomyces sp. NBC_00249]|uniref:SDR family NAD(P)-dependent oxidoreductase n=1 Tax=Streptomyces sp. NBC_00249 TaxID=2975690 RepID=UPI00224DC59D|nr:SDR family NAD(P)-dependent oxidoreductase [Streptomyces sp. NBC_00249]MCX5199407.1 SDR family NAD(P)-dependent oxidoreductase [Streptomyces sp. NBC_00249]